LFPQLPCIRLSLALRPFIENFLILPTFHDY
jgi:hypothetical protein